MYVIFCGFMGHTMFGIYDSGYDTFANGMWSCIDFFFNSFEISAATLEHTSASGTYVVFVFSELV